MCNGIRAAKRPGYGRRSVGDECEGKFCIINRMLKYDRTTSMISKVLVFVDELS